MQNNSHLCLSFFLCLKPNLRFSFGYSFIYQGTSFKKHWSDLFSLRVKLPPVTTSLATQS